MQELARERFASFDGTPIAYTALTPPGGDDDPVVLLANGLGGTMEAFEPLMERLPPRRYVSWDYRGLHRSGRPVDGYRSLTMPHHAKDAVALLDHLGHRRVHAVGWSMGVQVLLEVMRLIPERVESLTLLGGVGGHPYKTVANTSLAGRVLPPTLRRLQKSDALVTRAVHLAVELEAFVPLMIRLGMCHHDLDRDLFRLIARGFKSLDLHLYLELLTLLGEHSAIDVLPSIRCPTLVMVGSGDLLTPIAAAQQLAAGIEGARLEVIPGGTHYVAVEMPEILARHVRRFWDGLAAERAPCGAPPVSAEAPGA